MQSGCAVPHRVGPRAVEEKGVVGRPHDALCGDMCVCAAVLVDTQRQKLTAYNISQLWTEQRDPGMHCISDPQGK